MKKKITKGLLAGLALILGISSSQAVAQDFSSAYITPRVIISRQNGDMSSSKWSGGGPFSANILGGEDNDTRFGFGVALGTDLSYSTSYPIRVELDYSYRAPGEFSSGPKVFAANGNIYTADHTFKVRSHSLMANVFYDFNTNSAISPYIGGGLGIAYLTTKYQTNMNLNGRTGSARMHDTDWNLAWNVGGGLAYHVSDNVAIDAGYRYVDLGSGEAGRFNIQHLGYSGNPKVDFTAHEFSVGLRFSGF